MAEISLVAKRKSIVLKKLVFSMTWFWSILKRYDVFEASFVNLESKYSFSEDINRGPSKNTE